jgi:Ca2+-binding RTX toxin-like protein
MTRRHQNKLAGSMMEALEGRRYCRVAYNATTQELVVSGYNGNDTFQLVRGPVGLFVAHTDERGAHTDNFWDASKPVARVKIYGYDGADSVGLEGPMPRTSVFGGNHNDTIDLSLVTVSGAANQAFWIRGDAGDDNITGSPLNDGIHCDAGNDTASGGGGVDAIFGWDGNDVISGGDGDDWLYGDNGNDQLSGQNGNDHLYGLAGNDALSGGEGDDLLNGGTGGDNMSGNNGNDFFEGNFDGFNDVMIGGFGTDSFDSKDATDFWFPF